jgi:hypothetical protein
MNTNSLIAASQFSPSSLHAPNAWVGHLPFAAWLIKEVAPKIFVELGTHSGNSYFSFCQSVIENNLPSKCYAVDSWQGDEHAGKYNNEIFSKVNEYHQDHYSGFSRLLRMKFDDALSYFADKSIDILHIDGLHTYEAVRHDFESWLPKLAPGAVVLFHDTNVRELDFGVWKLWEELQKSFPNNLEFVHSHGLGVLQLNETLESNKIEWLRPTSANKNLIKGYFATLGVKQLALFELMEKRHKIHDLNLENFEKDEKIRAYHNTVLGRDEYIAEKDKSIAEKDKVIAEKDKVIAEKDKVIAEKDNSVGLYHVAMQGRDEQIADLSKELEKANLELKKIISSRYWRIGVAIKKNFYKFMWR